MVHTDTLPAGDAPRQGRPLARAGARGRLRRGLAGALTLSAGLLTACSDQGPAGPGSLRFGQIGRVRIDLTTPLLQGELHQVLTWGSSGPWEIEESISYRGRFGDDNTRRSTQLPGVLAGSYANWIVRVNDVPSTRLFIESLPPDSESPGPPTCLGGQSRVVLTIRDTSRGEELSWTRCVTGRLESLTTAGAGPDAPAARIAQAVILARSLALEPAGYQSAYAGSVPFGTIDRGEEPGVPLSESFVVSDQDAWENFWAEHRGPTEPAPPIDFGEDLVIVGAVGLRREAGDSVEVRRILPVGDRTFVERVERVPGDFCSPAEKLHHPFHVVVAPRVPFPVRFVEPVAVERVTCGG